MECFDISNISNTHIVASMVRFKNGVPDRSNYRRYRIQTTDGQNDFASMAEVVRRRYSRLVSEGAAAKDDNEFTQEPPAEAMARSPRAPDDERNPRFVSLPDLIIVDGGKGQFLQRLQGTPSPRPLRCADHRPRQGVRGNLIARPGPCPRGCPKTAAL